MYLLSIHTQVEELRENLKQISLAMYVCTHVETKLKFIINEFQFMHNTSKGFWLKKLSHLSTVDVRRFVGAACKRSRGSSDSADLRVDKTKIITWLVHKWNYSSSEAKKTIFLSYEKILFFVLKTVSRGSLTSLGKKCSQFIIIILFSASIQDNNPRFVHFDHIIYTFWYCQQQKSKLSIEFWNSFQSFKLNEFVFAHD